MPQAAEKMIRIHPLETGRDLFILLNAAYENGVKTTKAGRRLGLSIWTQPEA